MVRKDKTFIDAIKFYFPSDIKDEEKHDTEIDSMFYFDKLKHILIIEKDQPKLVVDNMGNSGG